MQVIRHAAAALSAALVLSSPVSAADAPNAAWVENLSEPTQCAEFDNVYYTLANPKVTRFEIEVSAPVYLPDLKTDSTGPDFANCEAMKDDPKHKFQPKKLTLYEDGDIRIVGHTYAESWRARGAEVMVGDIDESDLHLVQWFQKVDGDFHEFLVVYPFDGYWRAKPIPTEAFPDAAYGTSFLVGPIEKQHRPIVDIAKLKIDPRARAFRMTFAKGGVGEIRIRSADRERVVLDVSVDGLPDGDPPAPFAAIRSMFVTPTNADVARINWRTDAGLYNEPIMEFKGANAHEIRFDRIELSRHNTSAPDVTFRGFAGPPPAR
ncbi:hypothetical protein [Hansschlegelia zhihuaiae]|uniref:hypothetical protein n=1 Tax=Hansschlegelia zhihuaiae TaxID=405005 RepID=UPI0013E8D012|nr:hypothetical protein [Hansschlegelia zhihuaiae]